MDKIKRYLQVMPGMPKINFVFILFSLPFVVMADQASPTPQAPAPVETVENEGPKLGMIDRQRDAISRKIVDVADSVDRFLGSSRYDEESNNTKIRLGSVSSIDYQKNLHHRFDTYFNLDLPATNKRFRLVIKTRQAKNTEDSSLPGFVDELADSQTDQPVTTPAEEDAELDGVSAAVQYILDSGDMWDVRASSGLLFTLPRIDPIAELRVRRNIPVDKWNARATNYLYWLASRDLTNDFRIELEKGLSVKNFLRSTSFATWEQRNKGWRSGQDFSLVHTLDHTKAYTWSTGLTDINYVDLRDHYYYISGRFRHMFHRQWVFYQFNLFANYPASVNYQFRPGMIFTLEFVLGK